MVAILWVIILILVIALICFGVAWIWFDKNPASMIVEANRKETMAAKGQFCANCKNKNRYSTCQSPRLTYEKMNPVTGVNETHYYNKGYNCDCKNIVGTKYCQWELMGESEEF